MFVLLCIYLCPFNYCIHLYEEEKASCVVPSVATAAVRSKVVVLLSLIHCLLKLSLCGSGCCIFRFVLRLHYVVSCQLIILCNEMFA